MNQSTNQLVEHFFRHESAKLIAVLTRAFGLRRIDLIEDMVQVAMMEAMNSWKLNGIPPNPSAWIHLAAKNRILDSLRREKTFAKAMALSGQTLASQELVIDQWLEDEHIADSLLRMMFVCCHPLNDRQTQIALTLKTLCGFGLSEVARALLLPIETVKKRIQRAKKSLAGAKVSLELPDDEQLEQRLDVVHDVLYLMFNEGYSTSRGADPIRSDICEEAARLCHLLCQNPCSSPATKALLALMLFHASRFEARTDDLGSVILLEDQCRSDWDHQLIGSAQGWLAQSKCGQPTTYHLEATIAMLHCIAPCIKKTDWSGISALYGRLLELHNSPMYELNQAIAIGESGATHEALTRLMQLKDHPKLEGYFLLDCAIARIHLLEDDTMKAVDSYLMARSKTAAVHEHELIDKKIRKLTEITQDDRTQSH